MKIQQERSFQNLEQSQQDLIQTITGALCEDLDQYEAIVERHAVAIEDLVTREHERTRSLAVEEAERSRQLMDNNHQETLHHEVTKENLNVSGGSELSQRKAGSRRST